MITSPKLRLTLRQGTVYFMQHRAATSPKPHFVILLNRDPLVDTLICVSLVTSKVEKRRAFIERAKYHPQTLVEFGPSDYPELSKPSAIDCNDVKTMSPEDFEKSVLNKNFAKPCRDLPPIILKKVIAGIKLSTNVRQTIKDLL